MQQRIVLVAEDVTARIIAETLLDAHGFRVHAVSGDGDIPRALHAPDVGVLVVDVGAPCPGGGKVVTRLQHHLSTLPSPGQPRILAILNGDPDAERVVHRLGADLVLHRPVSPAQLLTSVEQLLRSTGPFDAVAA